MYRFWRKPFRSARRQGVYYLKEELRLLWSQPSFELMSRFLHNWCVKALESGIAQMVSLAKTLRTHARGILNFFHHPISTGRLEGLNNKIACLKRAAYHPLLRRWIKPSPFVM